MFVMWMWSPCLHNKIMTRKNRLSVLDAEIIMLNMDSSPFPVIFVLNFLLQITHWQPFVYSLDFDLCLKKSLNRIQIDLHQCCVCLAMEGRRRVEESCFWRINYGLMWIIFYDQAWQRGWVLGLTNLFRLEWLCLLMCVIYTCCAENWYTIYTAVYILIHRPGFQIRRIELFCGTNFLHYLPGSMCWYHLLELSLRDNSNKWLQHSPLPSGIGFGGKIRI